MPSDTMNEPDSVASEAPVPWTTLGLVGLISFIFVIQGAAAYIPGWDFQVPDLLAFGALNPDLVEICGEWWRLVTAPLLHANPMHLLMNAIALFFAGRFIEMHLGGIILAGMLAVGAVAGAAASMLWGDARLVSVGASGGIMTLLAAALFLCYTLPAAADTISGRSLFLRILVPSMIPTHDGVDYAAHFGGAVAGLLIVAAISALDTRARFSRGLALLVAAAYVCVAVFGTTRLMATAASQSHAPAELPLNATPGLLATRESDARALVMRYPQDPQAYLVLSFALYESGHPAEAESSAIAGLRQARLGTSAFYELTTTPELKAMIALGRAATERTDSGRRLAAPLCEQIGPPFRERLDRQRLCP